MIRSFASRPRMPPITWPSSGASTITSTGSGVSKRSNIVAERTREIGVRMALGAQAAQVRRMVVAQGARVVAVGVAIGVVGALASTRALGSLLFGVGAVDPVTFVGMSASMVAVGLLASYVPARRASNVDPIESLRGD